MRDPAPGPGINVDFAPACSEDLEPLAALRVEAMRDSLVRIGRFDPARARERLRADFSPSDTRHIIVDGQRVGLVATRVDGDALLLEHLYLRPDTHGFQLVARREFDNDYVRPPMCRTARLTLRPATIALARAEIDDRAGLARHLGAIVPDNWPPESIVDALPLFLEWMEAAPDALGWFAWHALATGTASAGTTLVGSGGFTGPPQEGIVNIGYSVLPQFQGRGYATEIVGGLVQWALRQPGVTCIAAETEWANPASVRVLNKAGFVRVETAAVPEGARFELTNIIASPG